MNMRNIKNLIKRLPVIRSVCFRINSTATELDAIRKKVIGLRKKVNSLGQKITDLEKANRTQIRDLESKLQKENLNSEKSIGQIRKDIQKLSDVIHAKDLSLPVNVRKGSSVSSGRTVSVIAWDMTHNCIGRAYALAQSLSEQYHVEIVGPCLCGNNIWAPIAGMTDITIKSLRAESSLRPSTTSIGWRRAWKAISFTSLNRVSRHF